MSRRDHAYLYVVVEKLNNMCILMPCMKQVTTEQTTHIFQHVWVHFGLPTYFVSYQDYCLLREFWSSLRGLMDTKLKKSMEFHPQTDGQTKEQ